MSQFLSDGSFVSPSSPSDTSVNSGIPSSCLFAPSGFAPLSHFGCRSGVAVLRPFIANKGVPDCQIDISSNVVGNSHRGAPPH